MRQFSWTFYMLIHIDETAVTYNFEALEWSYHAPENLSIWTCTVKLQKIFLSCYTTVKCSCGIKFSGWKLNSSNGMNMLVFNRYRSYICQLSHPNVKPWPRRGLTSVWLISLKKTYLIDKCLQVSYQHFTFKLEN